MDTQGKIIPIAIEDEIKTSYLNYAMSVIISRALPDVRDGLKPVHRRILYSMSEMGLRHDRPFKKCGRIVGDVLGKYHPHGDQSIYDALVRLAQDFSMRYRAVQGQGNFGSVDGDSPAAMRYTEARLEAIAEEMLRDINKETVDFAPNYDESMSEPTVLPAAVPYLLVNGASGIAVGMATNMLPHNLVEVCNAVAALIDAPDATSEALMEHISGPDFPTSGIIYGTQGIREAYLSGKGPVVVRARTSIESLKNGKERIVISELPYTVNKAKLIVRIAELVRNKQIDGISDLRDESDRNGMRVVVELRKDVIPQVVLNQLFAHTAMQQTLWINALAIVDGVPKLLTLRDIVWHFVRHRKEVVERRTRFDLARAKERLHILQGLKIALDAIDEVIETIKSSQDTGSAKSRLMDRFDLSSEQAVAILDMRLQRLTSLQTQKIVDELEETVKLIAELEELLSSDQKLLELVKSETLDIAAQHGDPRSTEIVPEEIGKLSVEDLIVQEDMVVLISNRGFIKRIPVSSYRRQGRGGRGSSSTVLKNEDFIEHLFIASTHDYMMFMSSTGKAYLLKVHELPVGSKAARGEQVKTLINLSENEEVTATVNLQELEGERYLFMATERGVVKRCSTREFRNAKTRGVIAIRLAKDDRLVSVLSTGGEDEVVLFSQKGRALRVSETQIRASGRSSMGIRGMKLREGDKLAGALPVREGSDMILVSKHGYGKRLEYKNITPHNRGTMGQYAYRDRAGSGGLVGVIDVREEDGLICITSCGNTVKLDASVVPKLGSAARGVRLVRVEENDFLVGVAKVIVEG